MSVILDDLEVTRTTYLCVRSVADLTTAIGLPVPQKILSALIVEQRRLTKAIDDAIFAQAVELEEEGFSEATIAEAIGKIEAMRP